MIKNKSLSKDDRLQWINYAKGLAIILVVYRHTLIGLERSGLEVALWLRQANEMVYSFRMPLFFILSGIFIVKSISKRPGSKFIRTKFETILYPYLVWGSIQITIQILLSDYTNAQRTWWDYLYLIIHPRAIDQMWYLFALFNSSALFYLFYQKFKLPTWLITLFALGMYALSPWMTEWSLIHDLCFYFIFLVIGYLSSQVLLNRENYSFFYSFKPFLFLTPFFWLSQWYYLHHQDMSIYLFSIIAVLGTAYVFSITFILSKFQKLSYLLFLGKHSLHIYLLHVLILAATRILLGSILGLNSAHLILFISWILACILPIYVYKLLNRPISKVLFEPRFK